MKKPEVKIPELVDVLTQQVERFVGNHKIKEIGHTKEGVPILILDTGGQYTLRISRLL